MTLVPDAMLARLLQDLYDPEALRRFLRSHEAYNSLDTALPGSQVSALQLSEAIVCLLRQHGLIDGPLFALLTLERPRRSADINAIAVLYGLPPAQAPTPYQLLRSLPPGGGSRDEAGIFRRRRSLLIGCLLSITVVIGLLTARFFDASDALQNIEFTPGCSQSLDPPALAIPDAADEPIFDVSPSLIRRPDAAVLPRAVEDVSIKRIAALLDRHESIVRGCVYRHQQENFHTPGVGKGYKIEISIHGSESGYGLRVLAPLPRQSRTVLCFTGSLEEELREISLAPPLIGPIGSRHYTIP